MTGGKLSRLDEAHVTDPSSVMHVGCIKLVCVGPTGTIVGCLLRDGRSWIGQPARSWRDRPRSVVWQPEEPRNEDALVHAFPMPQQQFAVHLDQLPNLMDLSRSVSPRIAQADRLQPERSRSGARADVDVGCLEAVAVFVRVEVAPVRAEAMNDGHADLGDRVGGRPSSPGALHSGLSRGGSSRGSHLGPDTRRIGSASSAPDTVAVQTCAASRDRVAVRRPWEPARTSSRSRPCSRRSSKPAASRANCARSGCRERAMTESDARDLGSRWAQLAVFYVAIEEQVVVWSCCGALRDVRPCGAPRRHAGCAKDATA